MMGPPYKRPPFKDLIMVVSAQFTSQDAIDLIIGNPGKGPTPNFGKPRFPQFILVMEGLE